MFSKAKSNKSGEGKGQSHAANDLAGSQNAAQGSSKKSGAMKATGVPSIISGDVSMRGNINSSGEIQFDGSLEGDIRAGSLIIGDKATVKGDVVCEAVTVRGRVEGSIRAKSVALASSAHILGDILHCSLSVESGAHFEGNCRHSDDPLSESSAKDFRRARPAGSPQMRAISGDEDSDQKSAAGGSPSFLNQNRSPLR